MKRPFPVQASGFTVLVAVAVLSGCALDRAPQTPDLDAEALRQAAAVGARHQGPAEQLVGGTCHVDPMLTAYVYGVGKRVAAATGLELPYDFTVIDRAEPSAWSLPGGKVAVSRGLLQALQNEAELAAVLAQVIARQVVAQRLQRGMLDHVLQQAATGADLEIAQSAYARTAVGSGQVAAVLLGQRLYGRAARAADEQALLWLAKAGYDVHAVAALQARPPGAAPAAAEPVAWYASYPPAPERLREHGELAAALARGGERGEARLERAVADLRAEQGVYAQLIRARRALADGRLDAARAAADSATASNSPLFHGVSAEIALQEHRFRDAIDAYGRALAHCPGYFAFHLGRGLARLAVGDATLARDDLERSIEQLPTATAYLELGRMAEAAGRRERAFELYQRAAASRSAAGRSARVRAIGIDLPRHPRRYVSVRAIDRAGRPELAVWNTTDIVLYDVNVRVRLEWSNGAVDELLPKVERLGAHEQRRVTLPARAAELLALEADVLTGRVEREAAEELDHAVLF